MIPRIPGWSWDVRGGGITLVPPEGNGAGAIRYRERLRPLRSAGALIAAKTEGQSAPFKHELAVTAEGEYATIVELQSAEQSRIVQRTFAFVFADDWYSEIAGLALRPDQFDRFSLTVRQLVRDTQLMLGVRRRRFLYTPPVGWAGYARLPLFTTWFPSTYPADPTSIVVYPAVPAPANEDVNFGMLTFGPPVSAEVIGDLGEPHPIATERLAGKSWDFDARDEHRRAITRRVVMLRDERYVYTTYLDAPSGELFTRVSVLDALVRSIEPIHMPGASRNVEVFEHYL